MEGRGVNATNIVGMLVNVLFDDIDTGFARPGTNNRSEK